MDDFLTNTPPRIYNWEHVLVLAVILEVTRSD